MPIGLLAKITVQQGKNEAFEQAFLELTAQVRANEPGNIFYALNRSQTDPQLYIVMEQYTDAEALEVHRKSDYFLAANGVLGGLVAGAPEIELFEALLG
jgi:quinol monooxygenase YgiN